MRIAILSLLLSISLAHSHAKKKNFQEMTEHEAKQEINAAMKQHAVLFKARYGPVVNTTHKEDDEERCSDFCRWKGGNGICEEQCRTRGCLEEMGDCPSHSFPSCRHLVCSSDSCHSECLFSGCANNCEAGNYRQHLLIFSPFLRPSDLFFDFERIEENIKEATDLKLKLKMLWGVESGQIDPFARIWPLFPIKKSYTETYALFEIKEGAFDPRDKQTLRKLQMLGGDSHLARVTPMVLGPQQMEKFHQFTENYDDERERMEQARNGQ